MAGLVGYDSSDEDAGERTPPRVNAEPLPSGAASAHPETEPRPADQHGNADQLEPPVVAPVAQSAVPLGPSLPPSMEEASALTSDWYRPEGSASPYSAKRALIHDLTLPAIPNLDIPPSPTGSPPRRATKSFEQFLALKKQGKHLNSQLEQSKALRNPGIMSKLTDFVGLDDQQMYETTLPPDLWNPKAFPESAFFDRLRKSRETVAKQREADRASGSRNSVDFVPSTATSRDVNAPVVSGLSKGDKSWSGWK